MLELRFLTTVFCPCVLIPWVLARSIFLDIPIMILESFPEQIFGTLLTLTLYFLIPLAISGKLFYWRFKKQYPLTPWWIAFLGSCYAFLIFPSCFVLGEGAHQDAFGWISLPVVNGFYFILCLADLLQKQLWPDNNLANRIRDILARSCINADNTFNALAESDAENLKRFQ